MVASSAATTRSVWSCVNCTPVGGGVPGGRGDSTAGGGDAETGTEDPPDECEWSTGVARSSSLRLPVASCLSSTAP
eukprot:7382624-Prymnesium_polylepis.1